MRVLCRNTWKMNCIKYEGKKIKYVEFVIKVTLFQHTAVPVLFQTIYGTV